MSDTGVTGCSTILVRTGTRRVHGAVGARPKTVAGVHERSSNPGSSQPTGSAGPSMFSVKSTRSPSRSRWVPGSHGPFRHPPPAVGHQHVGVAVGVVHVELGDHAVLAGRMALGRSLPVGHQPEGVGRPRPEQPGHVERLVVHRVGIAVGLALAGAHPVDVELVLLVPGDEGPGPDDGAPAQRHLATGIGVLVGLGRGVGEPPDPRGPPVPVGEPGLEDGRRRRRTRRPGAVPGLHGPPVGGVGRQRRSAVGDEGLFGGGHLTAVPDGRGLPRPADRSGHHDAVGALTGAPAHVLQLPGEVDVVGRQPDGHGQAVDRQGRRTPRPRRSRRRHRRHRRRRRPRRRRTDARRTATLPPSPRRPRRPGSHRAVAGGSTSTDVAALPRAARPCPNTNGQARHASGHRLATSASRSMHR